MKKILFLSIAAFALAGCGTTVTQNKYDATGVITESIVTETSDASVAMNAIASTLSGTNGTGSAGYEDIGISYNGLGFGYTGVQFEFTRVQSADNSKSDGYKDILASAIYRRAGKSSVKIGDTDFNSSDSWANIFKDDKKAE